MDLTEPLDFDDFEIPKDLRPGWNGKPLPMNLLLPYFGCHVWYKYEGILLAREETLEIMRMFFLGEQYPMINPVFDNFENPAHQMTQKLQGLDIAL